MNLDPIPKRCALTAFSASIHFSNSARDTFTPRIFPYCEGWGIAVLIIDADQSERELISLSENGLSTNTIHPTISHPSTPHLSIHLSATHILTNSSSLRTLVTSPWSMTIALDFQWQSMWGKLHGFHENEVFFIAKPLILTMLPFEIEWMSNELLFCWPSCYQRLTQELLVPITEHPIERILKLSSILGQSWVLMKSPFSFKRSNPSLLKCDDFLFHCQENERRDFFSTLSSLIA